MNFSQGHSGTKVQCEFRACFPKEKHQNSQKWAKFMNFSFCPFLWFGLPGRLLNFVASVDSQGNSAATKNPLRLFFKCHNPGLFSVSFFVPKKAPGFCRLNFLPCGLFRFCKVAFRDPLKIPFQKPYNQWTFLRLFLPRKVIFALRGKR